MKTLLVIFISTFFLFSCVSRTYKDTMNGYIGRNVNLYWSNNFVDYHISSDDPGYAYYGKQQTDSKDYDEYILKHISYFSKTKGICTTIFKVRKSDNIIVSWRSEGKKSDCVWRNYYE